LTQTNGQIAAAIEAAETPDTDTRLALYRLMQDCRMLEQRAYDLFMQNLIKGTSHLALGQEAVAAGFGAAMREDDYSFCTYRGHNHTLVRGVSMTGILGELMGRECGLLRGKGGSMHLMSVEHGAMGSYAIVGAHMPIAAGAAWSAQYRESGQVAVCFFGDGTTNIGAFHEALNFSVIWSLPVVYVCENNLYMEYTPIGGNDADLVYAVAKAALDKARSGGGPTLVEVQTYRHGGHSPADPGKYRPDEEVAAWLERDPLKLYRKRLIDAGMDAAALDQIDAESLARIDEAEEAARNSPPPPLEIADTDVWSDGSATWRN
jgi:pyruvate dehydrogenase E1 component alpha subunit